MNNLLYNFLDFLLDFLFDIAERNAELGCFYNILNDCLSHR